MKKIIYTALCLGWSLWGFGQIGVSGSFTWFKADPWEEFVDENIGDYIDDYFFQNGFQAGVDYRFRLKNVRVEFLPELRYAQFEASPKSIYDEGTMKWQGGSFHWNTNIYPFDLTGDCDCPTFSKDDPIFEKGFFVQVSPGIHYLRESYYSEKKLILLDDQEDIAYSIGLGAGLDLGISKWLTISPYGRLTYLVDGEWPGFGSLLFFPDTGSPAPDIAQPYELWIPEAGLRIGIHFKQ